MNITHIMKCQQTREAYHAVKRALKEKNWNPLTKVIRQTTSGLVQLKIREEEEVAIRIDFIKNQYHKP